MIDLDNLLDESVALREKGKREKQAQAAEKKANRAPKTDTRWMSGAEQEAMREANRIARTKSDDWKPVAAVLFFQRQHCQNCGGMQGHYQGLFVRGTHRKYEAERLLPPGARIEWEHLPREVKLVDSYQPMCIDCYDSFEDWSDPDIPITQTT